MTKKKERVEVKHEEVFKPNCFAYSRLKRDGCEILRGVHVPRDCKNCRFKKPKRDYTDGKYYLLINWNK